MSEHAVKVQQKCILLVSKHTVAKQNESLKTADCFTSEELKESYGSHQSKDL